MPKKAHLSIAIGFGLSAVLLVWLLSQLEWSKFLQELGRVQLFYLPILVAVFTFSQYIRSLRWRALLPSRMRTTTMELFSACNLGALATCVLPLRAGEFIRPWVLSRRGEVAFSRAFSSVVTERVFDVLAMLTLFVITLGGIESPPAWAYLGARALGALAGAILVVMIVSYFFSSFVLSVMHRVFDALFAKRAPQLGKKLSAMGEEFVHGLKDISSFGELLLVLFLSYALWLCLSVYYYLGLRCLGIEGGFAVANAVNVFVALAVAVPSAPGFIGTFQVGCIAALVQIHHFSEELATAYSVVLHSVQMITTIALGYAMLQYEGLSFSQLRSREQDSSLAPSATGAA